MSANRDDKLRATKAEVMRALKLCRDAEANLLPLLTAASAAYRHAIASLEMPTVTQDEQFVICGLLGDDFNQTTRSVDAVTLSLTAVIGDLQHMMSEIVELVGHYKEVHHRCATTP